MKEKVENQEHELNALTLKISKTEELFIKMKYKNLSLIRNLKKFNRIDGKGKKEASRIHIDHEEKLRASQQYLMESLHENQELERDQVRMKEI